MIMIISSPIYTYKIPSHKSNVNVCDIQDGMRDSNMSASLHTGDVTWEPSIYYLATAVPFLLFLFLTTRGDTSQDGALRSARKMTTILLIALSTIQMWKVDFVENDFIMPEGNYWIFSGFLVLVYFVYKFSSSKKWARSIPSLTFWLFVLVTSCVSVLDIIRQEAYKKNVSGLVLSLGILGLVVGHLLLSVSRDSGTKPPIDDGGATQPKLPVHSEDEASFLSKLFLDWVFGFVWAGYKRKLREADIPNVNIRDKCDTIFPAFERAWRDEKLKCRRKVTNTRLNLKPEPDSSSGRTDDQTDSCGHNSKDQRASLLYALIRAYGRKYFFLQFLNCALKLSDFVYPLMIESLMKYVQNRSSEPQWKGYGLIVAACLTAVLTDTMHPRLCQSLRRLTCQMKMVMTVAVYKKALTLSNDSRKEKTAGQLVSLVSEDLDKITHAMEEIYLVVLTPLQTLVAVYLLYNQLGMVALLALVILLCLIPINYWLGRKLESLEERKNDVKDARINVMNEVLNGIKVLKLYAWEKSFIGKICGIREEEMAVSKKIGLCYAGLDMIFRAILLLVRFIGLVSVVMMGEHLDSPKAFLTMTLFMLLSYPFSEVAVVIPACVQARVSLTRINDFLTDKDIADDVVTVNSDADASVIIQDGTFSWDPTLQPTLKKLNLVIPKGGLVAVVGMVGSGKSSLLSAMLGEMEKQEGKVTVQSITAYVPQEAWIQNATLRDNILFGSEFQAEKYDQIIGACALKDDFKILAAGDKTEIGEKGINLSGGQKQRVSLARAVYSDADIFLFDDPLSAVDAHVGKHIFNKVIGHRGMLKNKTRVLVTHGIHWLPFVDNIIVMKDGSVSECGTYKQLLAHNGAFAQFLKEVFSHGKQEDDSEVEQIKKNIYTRLISLDENEHQAEIVLLGENSAIDEDEKDNSTIDEDERDDSTIDEDEKDILATDAEPVKTESTDNSNDNKDEENDEARGKIIDDEDTEFGSVSLSVYREYLMAVGPFWVLLFSVVFTVTLASRDFSALWVGKWTEDPLLANVSLANTAEYRSTLWMYVSVYAFCGIFETVMAFLFSMAINKRSLSAATQLHTKLLTNILRYPMSFFDTTPSGRIINRFSKDVDRLGEGLDGYIQCAGEVLTNLVMILYITPRLIPFICLVSGVYIFLQLVYIPSARQLRRYKAKFSSPVFTHFKETLDGTHTLRAFKAQDRFVCKMKNTIEEQFRFDLMHLLVRVWFGMKISTLSQCVSLAAGLIVMWDESISPSHAGLLLSFSSWFVESLGWYVMHASYTEQELVSLERVIEYSNKCKEAAWEVPGKSPAHEWPQNGEIILDDYQARYRDGLDLVLKGVTCSIYSGEKIGIVGRTGAGKSSLTVALFRLVEAASGQITVDDHQIASLGLHDLRKKITILPQDPVIFGGSLHMNLDPFSEKSTEELWEALKHSHLQTFVENLPGKLDYECGEAGKNLSVGQRQLVCLARTLLRKTKILVLDEATAAVDMETDDLIQKTICSEFKDCTVLTIAHRLNTIMDYDRILVMEQGLVKEFDSPKKLLANPESSFYAMAKDANLI